MLSSSSSEPFEIKFKSPERWREIKFVHWVGEIMRCLIMPKTWVGSFLLVDDDNLSHSHFHSSTAARARVFGRLKESTRVIPPNEAEDEMNEMLNSWQIEDFYDSMHRGEKWYFHFSRAVWYCAAADEMCSGISRLNTIGVVGLMNLIENFIQSILTLAKRSSRRVRQWYRIRKIH